MQYHSARAGVAGQIKRNKETVSGLKACYSKMASFFRITLIQGNIILTAVWLALQ
jgi:hypothetical protein